MSESIPTTGEVREAASKGFLVSMKYGSIPTTQFDSWLAEHDRALSERRWSEGFEAGQDEADGHEAAWQWGRPHTCITNPYRKETE